MAGEPDTNIPEWQLQITERVRLLLAQRRRTQRELAQAMEMTPSELSRCMTTQGVQRRQWQVPDLLKIADFFEVDPGLLLSDNVQQLLDRPEAKPKPSQSLAKH